MTQTNAVNERYALFIMMRVPDSTMNRELDVTLRSFHSELQINKKVVEAGDMIASYNLYGRVWSLDTQTNQVGERMEIYEEGGIPLLVLVYEP